MKAAKIYGKRDIRVEEVAIPELSKGMVVVKVEFAGICGSDLHEYSEGPFSIRTHSVMGHEFSGIVTEIGEGVTTVKAGDRVAVEPIIACGQCINCKKGYVNLCKARQGYGYTESGGFAQYAVVKQENVFKLPDEMSLELGALVEPTAVAVHAVRESQLKLGDTAAIYGAGPIGLLLLQSVKAAGASMIFVVEVSEERRQKALELGATFVLNPLECNIKTFIHSKTNGGVNVAFDVAGVQETFLNGVTTVQSGGEYKIVSLWENPVTFQPNAIVTAEISVSGSYAYRNLFPEVIRLLACGIIDGNAIITSVIPLDRIVEEGFEVLMKDHNQCKILVEMDI
ncbi:2,3-butanediol dehydrogenase [Gottfriedia sp. NPDC057991]|uniref:2,3-butanediol dehydrogenase n=1 Tax=Gottfriedia sp. NPDC057991 TaxID=3346298 RepID=UPI0036DD7E16